MSIRLSSRYFIKHEKKNKKINENDSWRDRETQKNIVCFVDKKNKFFCEKTRTCKKQENVSCGFETQELFFISVFERSVLPPEML